MRSLDPHDDHLSRGHGLIFDYFDRRRYIPPKDLAVRLAPFIKNLQDYDGACFKIHKQGGYLSDVNRITGLLNAKFTLEDGYRGPQEVSLTDTVALRLALRQIGEGDLYLDVRQLDSRLPVYYLCRVARNWWGEYSFVTEDYHRSPGYTFRDERFAKIMGHFGHEQYFLRLSPYRSGLAAILNKEESSLSELVDQWLESIGRHVFEPSWHEDQAVGRAVASQFQLPLFGQAIELLYLSLSGELCEIRAPIQPTMLQFFEVVYPQPAIRGFLELLTNLDGGALSEIPKKALKLYSRLAKAFSKFIQVEVTWGNRHARIPLYKLIFANLTRLQLVAQALEPDKQIDQAAQLLEEEAQMVIGAILTSDSVTSPNLNSAQVLRG